MHTTSAMTACRDRLAAGARVVGVELTASQLDALLRLGAQLLDWNERVNLTAIRTPEGVVDRHLIDSLAVAPHVVPGTLVDVGTGAGFPGLPLAIVRPDLQVTLLESIHKKTAFVRAAARDLSIACEVVTERLETWSKVSPLRENAVSRATFAPKAWLELGAPLVAPGGVLVIMTTPAEPPLEAPRGFEANRFEYALPDGTVRTLWRMRRFT